MVGFVRIATLEVRGAEVHCVVLGGGEAFLHSGYWYWYWFEDKARMLKQTLVEKLVAGMKVKLTAGPVAVDGLPSLWQVL